MMAAPDYLTAEERTSWAQLAPIARPKPEHFAAFESLACDHALARRLWREMMKNAGRWALRGVLEPMEEVLAQVEARVAAGLVRFRVPADAAAAIANAARA